MIIEEIKKNISLAEIISSFGGTDGFFCLDSGCYGLPRSRYSFIGLQPDFSVYATGKEVFLNENNKLIRLDRDLLKFIKEFIEGNNKTQSPFPFSCGFIGYLTYNFGWTLDKFRKDCVRRVLNLPIAKFNYYSEILAYDHKNDALYYLNDKDIKNWRERLKGIKNVARKNIAINTDVKRLRSSFSFKSYKRAILKTKEYIRSGDIYQANISQRFSLDFNHDAIDFYLRLREISPAPFGAYLKDNSSTVICNSPERFLFKKGRYIETCPIKGTRKRYFDGQKDRASKKELRKSEKDKAEHLMIIDLERNDLGKICEIGSVNVKNMFSIESYANVHHMVSTVYGKLKDGLDITDCIRATFPGGSITGAPKLRSMEIIEELEPVKRGIYCGSIGYIDKSGNADFNIAIRTGVVTNNRLYFYVGGGIVADSQPELEYEETITKAKSFLSALNLSELKE